MNPAEDSEPTSDLRARLHSRHLQLQATGPGPWPEDMVTATLNDTVALLNAQQQHAAQAAARRRAEGARAIRTAARAGSAVLAIEAIAALTGLLPRGWLTAFGLMLLGTLTIWGSEKGQPSRGQSSRLTAAVLLDIAAVWTGVVAGAGVSLGWATPAIGLAIVAGFTWFDSALPTADSRQEKGGRR
jgi:hypothetical protein